ncbi:threonine aldolase family protein [Rhodopila globiformis]|uniref:Low specificity L-threonine aldolase n=1 Tax=Rhodopila globiformis TaxID=1071 RepID=A0A2S6NLU6_RHOGL|nr:threonine aldolase family protein [Rhodopila globiformis]PPQ36575.1 low specificity L-threonine aldolase [Rhodopila globiformis]
MSYEPKRADFSVPVRINLYSDTQTRPSPAMKEAMMAAEVGDEQGGSDPTVWELCDRTAALLGKEAAMFMPSGTMCNQVALATHCRPGDEILAHEDAHIQSSEAGGPGAISGVMIRGLPGARGIFSADTLRDAIRPVSRYAPAQRLVEVEQTANKGGGACWPIGDLKAVADVAHQHGMKVHMDGARVLNAAVALGVAAADVVADCDTVWLDFTKGLGAPLGAVLAGPGDFIGEAWRWKQRLGGSMRQGGMNAAACIYALQHNVARLAEDHANAAGLAHGMAQIPGIVVEMPETNMVFFDTKGAGLTAAELAARLRPLGVTISVSGSYRGRACTHLDVTAAQIEEAVAIMRSVIAA